MKKFLVIYAFLILFYPGCGQKSEPEISEQLKGELREDANQFMASLKNVLVKEMQANGLVSAVSVCSDTAQVLSKSYGNDKGMNIKRVSFKNRNPVNNPDEVESKALDYFTRLKDEGTLNEKSEYFSTTEEDGFVIVRYLKPIIVQAPCLSCHGAEENMSQDVKAILNEKYPEDKATGYQAGDLRGAVSIIKRI